MWYGQILMGAGGEHPYYWKVNILGGGGITYNIGIINISMIYLPTEDGRLRLFMTVVKCEPRNASWQFRDFAITLAQNIFSITELSFYLMQWHYQQTYLFA